MRRIHIVLGMLGVVTVGAISAVAGCGSDDPAPIAPPLDAATGTDTSTSSSTGGPGTSTSSSSSSGGDTDGGGSTTSSSGTVASNAGKITCGTVECDAGGGGNGGGGLCCSRDGGTNPVCLRGNQAGQCDNSQGENTLQISCDETADCPKVRHGARAPGNAPLAAMPQAAGHVGIANVQHEQRARESC